MFLFILVALLSLFATVVDAGTISRPAKSFGGTIFVNGVVPQASDFNGDPDTIYSEFNGNIDNNNIKVAAAIAASKISPDGFTTNVRTVHTLPCNILEESDQAGDAKRWAMCVSGGVLQLGTYTDAGTLQNNWFTIVRANGGFTLGGTSGTNVVSGVTTFNQAVTFVGGTSFNPVGAVQLFMGLTAPSGWLLMDGASSSCTGAGGINGSLCNQLVSLYPTVNYKGAVASTITVDTSSDEVLHSAHGKVVNDRVHFTSTTTLPTPIVATIAYCITSITTDRFKISATCGGAAIDITDTGTGTHSDYFNFVVPDARGRNAIGTGTGAGLTARVIGATGGAESGSGTTDSYVLTIAEMPAHTHQSSAAPTGVIGSPGGVSFFGAISGGPTGSTGGGGGHTHSISSLALMDPFLVMTYIIKL